MKARAEHPSPSPERGVSRTNRATRAKPSRLRRGTGRATSDSRTPKSFVKRSTLSPPGPKATRDPFCGQSANSSRSIRSWRRILPSGVPLTPGRHEVGHGVQPDVELAPAQAVEAVQAPDGVVPLEDADPLPEVRQPYPRRQAGQPGSDDRYVVVRARIQLFAASALNFGVRYSAQLSREASCR